MNEGIDNWWNSSFQNEWILSVTRMSDKVTICIESFTTHSTTVVKGGTFLTIAGEVKREMGWKRWIECRNPFSRNGKRQVKVGLAFSGKISSPFFRHWGKRKENGWMAYLTRYKCWYFSWEKILDFNNSVWNPLEKKNSIACDDQSKAIQNLTLQNVSCILPYFVKPVKKSLLLLEYSVNRPRSLFRTLLGQRIRWKYFFPCAHNYVLLTQTI